MNTLESNNNLSFSHDFSFLSEFSSGIEYCQYEQQIELSIGLVAEKKQKKALSFKIEQILNKWKKGIDDYTHQLFKYQKNRLREKPQSLLKKISTDTAWASSLLALTSIGILAEIAPIWSDINQNLALKLPFLKTLISVDSSAEKLFPLLAMEEINLIIGRNEFDNWQSKKLNRGNNKAHDFGILPPINYQVNQQKWLMHPTKSNGSLMAIPPSYDQPSVAGFPSFLSTLDFINFQKDFHLNKLNLLNKKKLTNDILDSVTYDIENNLMATPKAIYKPYLPKANFVKRN